MKSTGEVMGTGRTFAEAYAKAQIASGVTLPTGGTAFLSVRDRDKEDAVRLGQMLARRGFDIVATGGTAMALAGGGVACRRVNKVREGRPHVVDMIKNNQISLIVNTTEGKQAIRESRTIRGAAVHRKVTYYTTMPAALATALALEHPDGGAVNRLQDLHAGIVQ
jgi:carbamoyl-phosphate synthase large subunit